MKDLYGNEISQDNFFETNNLFETIMSKLSTRYNAAITIDYDPYYLDEICINNNENMKSYLNLNFYGNGITAIITLDIDEIYMTYEESGLEVTLDEIYHYIDSEILYITKNIFYRM